MRLWNIKTQSIIESLLIGSIYSYFLYSFIVIIFDIDVYIPASIVPIRVIQFGLVVSLILRLTVFRNEMIDGEGNLKFFLIRVGLVILLYPIAVIFAFLSFANSASF